MARLRAAAAGTLTFVLLASAFVLVAQRSDSQRSVSAAAAARSITQVRQPLAFEPNAARFGPDYDFVVRGKGATLGVTAGRSTLALGGHRVLRTQVVGANPRVTAHGVRKLPGGVNWYL